MIYRRLSTDGVVANWILDANTVDTIGGTTNIVNKVLLRVILSRGRLCGVVTAWEDCDDVDSLVTTGQLELHTCLLRLLPVKPS